MKVVTRFCYANLISFYFFTPNLYMFCHTQTGAFKNIKTYKEEWYATKIRRRGNVAPFPSKPPFETMRIQKLPCVLIWISCQIAYLFIPYDAYPKPSTYLGMFKHNGAWALLHYCNNTTTLIFQLDFHGNVCCILESMGDSSNLICILNHTPS